MRFRFEKFEKILLNGQPICSDLSNIRIVRSTPYGLINLGTYLDLQRGIIINNSTIKKSKLVFWYEKIRNFFKI